MIDYVTNSPKILVDFLSYHETIKAHSPLTVDEYFLDMRNFFRFLKRLRDPELKGKELKEIPIADVDLDFVAGIGLSELFQYLAYLSREKDALPATRARKIATLRSFFNYLSSKTHQLNTNPAKDLDSPRLNKTLPRYLTLAESLDLLESVDGRHVERDYCILTLFLNCGLRISELVGLNIPDIQGQSLRVEGKGGKVRILHLNDACRDALNEYLKVRPPLRRGKDVNALFISGQNRRISRSAVHSMVKRRIAAAGLDSTRYSSHKLRHTAATLMLQNGVDVRTVQEVLGHEHLNTTEIYTHIDNEGLRVAARANPLSKVKRKR